MIVATCSLTIGSIVALGLESNVPYSPSKALDSTGRKASTDLRRSLDLAPSASSITPGAVQPSVYHSIIDRSEGSSRPASPVQTSSSTIGDLNTAAGHHHGHAHGKYYEYREVPKKKTWKFGYKRGNHKHHIERHEHGEAGKHPHFKTKVKWADKKSKGKGIHLWDYNHHDKKHYHHG